MQKNLQHLQAKIKLTFHYKNDLRKHILMHKILAENFKNKMKLNKIITAN